MALSAEPQEKQVTQQSSMKSKRGPSKRGKGTLLVDGETVAEGRIGVTQAGLFYVDETADIGIDLGTPAVEAIGAEAKSRFTGRIPKV